MLDFRFAPALAHGRTGEVGSRQTCDSDTWNLPSQRSHQAPGGGFSGDVPNPKTGRKATSHDAVTAEGPWMDALLGLLLEVISIV